MSSPLSTTVLGSTGLVGKSILEEVNRSSQFATVLTVSRRAPSVASAKIQSTVETDTSKWPEIIAKTPTNVFFSAFGTTRAAAGSAKNFEDIDYGINYEAAKAAKEAGADTYVLISSFGANPNSFLLYPKTKGRLERDVIALKFNRTLILQPGMLIGEREEGKGGLEQLAVGLAKRLVGTPLQFLGYPVYGDKLAKIAVDLASEGWTGTENEVRVISPTEITKRAKEL